MNTQVLHPLDRGSSRRLRRRGSFAALLLALILLGWLATRAEQKAQPANPRPSPMATSRTTPAASRAGSITWSDLGGLALPVSPIAGPHLQAAGRAASFAHSATGAAFAAVHLLVRTFPFAGAAIFVPTIAQQVEGPDAAALARLTTDAYAPVAKAAGVRDGGPIRSEGGWIAGYRLDDPDRTATSTVNDRPVVRVLIRQVGEPDADGFNEYRVPLVWQDGDWRLIAPAWGDWRSAVTPMASADPARYARYDAGRA